MIDRLYYRLQDLKQVGRNIRTRWWLLTYKDKYKHEQGKKGNTNE